MARLNPGFLFVPMQRFVHQRQDHLDMLLHHVHVGAFLSRSRQRFDVVQHLDRIDGRLLITHLRHLGLCAC